MRESRETSVLILSRHDIETLLTMPDAIAAVDGKVIVQRQALGLEDLLW